jgi:hypothetical protein
MKKQFNFLLVILIIIVLAYLLRPPDEMTHRLWVVKGITLTEPYRAAVMEYWQNTQQLPVSIDDLGLEKILVRVDFDKTAVASITVGENGPGTVTVHYSTAHAEKAPPAIHNTRIILVPVLMDEGFAWGCKGTLPRELLPVPCHSLSAVK